MVTIYAAKRVTVVLRNSRETANPSLPKMLDLVDIDPETSARGFLSPPVVSRAAPSCASMFLVGLKSVAMSRGDKNGEKG